MTANLVSFDSSTNQNNVTIHIGDVYNVNVSQSDTLDALRLFQGIDNLISPSAQNFFDLWSPLPDCFCLPYPEPSLSSAPAGKGLETDTSCEWGDCAVTTAGGYTIVAEGKSAGWAVYGPGQKPGDTPLTRIWGDPHVQINGQQAFDFTRDSDFILPDGTLIHVDTTSETGKSVTKGLTIVNGADRVELTGIHKNRPQLGQVTRDGYEWRAEHVGTKSLDTYRMGGTEEDISFFKEVDGVEHGEVTGSYFDHTTNRYEQVIDCDQCYWVDGDLKPDFWSKAWGNEFRSNMVDMMSELGLPPEMRGLMAKMISLDHSQAEFQEAFKEFLLDNLFGGLFSAFANPVSFFDSVGDLTESITARRGRGVNLLAARAQMIVA